MHFHLFSLSLILPAATNAPLPPNFQVFIQIFACPRILSGPGAIELKEAIETSKWIEVSDPAHIPHILLNAIEQGEAEAIALAKKEGLVLLIDERRGRKVAKKEKVKITGTGAVLVDAKKKGIIEKVAPALDELLECGYRISRGLRKKILELAKEDDGM